MEILNNVQLEGRRINVEISKMMVAEDVTITEEVLVVLVAEEVQLKKVDLHQDEGSGGFRSDSSALEKVVLEEDSSAQEEKVVYI
jgi:hypothetical protein